jgi:alpha-tubulin suppressor-like RCC1 family protein
MEIPRCVILPYHFQASSDSLQVHRLIPTVIESLQHACITRVASMSTYTLAIDSNGNAYVWGTGGSATNTGLKNDIQPQVLEALPNKAVVKDVACGLGHTLFLVEGGRVYAWGNGGNGRLGLGNCTDRTESCLITGDAAKTVLFTINTLFLW